MDTQNDANIEVSFIFDNTTATFRADQIQKILEEDEARDVFYVFRPGTGRKLHRVEGVVFMKAGTAEVAKPQLFETDDPGDAQPKKKHHVSVGGAVQVNTRRSRRRASRPPQFREGSLHLKT